MEYNNPLTRLGYGDEHPAPREASLSQSYKICPICGTPTHRNAALCPTCGTTLSDVKPVGNAPPPENGKSVYDHRYGETDLYEGQLSRRGQTVFVGFVVALALLACAGVIAFAAPRLNNLFAPLFSPSATPTRPPTFTPVPTRGGTAEPAALEMQVVTNTPRPTLQFATVTPAPPTETPTPTIGPCIVTVQEGDSLFSLAGECGHRHLDVVDLIVEINDLDAPESIQIGQVIEIPLPTPTLDPNQLPTEESADDGSELAADRTLAPVEQALANSAAASTATLQAGVQWHRIVAGENIMSIAFSYGADIEILSQLNPEVTFSQCDFGSPTGGPNCIVQIYEGQLIRVPAPTPTPTIPPTASGSETPTPTATPTFNAPSLTDPGNRSLFTADQLITLRWVATGTLGAGQVYHVRVEDTTAGLVYTADTQELTFIVPEDWQGRDGRRHDYTWQISVIPRGNPNDPTYTTESRMFSWDSRGANT